MCGKGIYTSTHGVGWPDLYRKAPLRCQSLNRRECGRREGWETALSQKGSPHQSAATREYLVGLQAKTDHCGLNSRPFDVAFSGI